MHKLYKLILTLLGIALVGFLTTQFIPTHQQYHHNSINNNSPNQYDDVYKFSQNQQLSKTTQINQIIQDKNGALWVSTVNNGIWERKDDKSTFVQNQDIKTNNTTSYIFADSVSNIWASTSVGLFEKQNDNNTFKLVSSLPVNIAVLQIFEDQVGNIWIGTRDQGAWEQPVGKTFTQNTTLKKFQILQIFADHEGDLWVSTIDNGVWEQENGKTTFAQNHDLVSATKVVGLFFEDKQSNLWFGTDGGLYERKATETKFILNKGLPADLSVSKIYQDNQESLWVGTIDNGLWKQINTETKFEQKMDGKSITHISQDEAGVLWIGTKKNGLWEQPQGQLSPSQNQGVPKPGQVTFILTDTDLNVWVGTATKGLWKKISTGIYITPTQNSPNHEFTVPINGVESDVWFYRDAFTIKTVEADVTSVKINQKTIQNPDLKGPINFPNSKYGIKSNQTFLFQVIYKINNIEYQYSKYFCIKSTYCENGTGGSDSIADALTSTGGKGLFHITAYLKGDNLKVKYLLFSDLAIDKASNPILTITTAKFNFLTDFSKSGYFPITITKGVITKGKRIPLEKAQQLKIPGRNIHNIYEVDLVDYLCNKQMFLIQVGGTVLNSHFVPTKVPVTPISFRKNKKWIYIGYSFAGVAVIFLLITLLGYIIWRNKDKISWLPGQKSAKLFHLPRRLKQTKMKMISSQSKTKEKSNGINSFTK